MSNAPVAGKATKGPIHAVPCPHCGHPNNLTGLQQQIGAAFEPGALLDCDKCGMVSVVVAVQPVVFVALKQDPKGRRRGVGPRQVQAPQPQRKPGLFGAVTNALAAPRRR